MLGSECNMDCIYCIQKNNKNTISRTVNKDVVEFIRFVAKNNFNQTLEIRFFGGEPLLFWKQIKDITNNLLDINNIQFSIITNGKLLDKEKVEYLNSNNFKIIISWDGNKSNITRKYDVINNNEDNILKCQNLILSGVLSKYVYPLELLKDFENFNNVYKIINSHDIEININLPINIQNNDVFNIDLKTIYSDYYKLVLFFLEQKNINSLSYKYIKNIIDLITRQLNINNRLDQLCRCKNGYNILNLDLSGNLYTCHESNIKIGTIYDDYFKYLNEVIKTESQSQKCLFCEAYPLCGGGCKLINKNDSYCDIRKTITAAITKAIEDYNVFSNSSN